MNFGITFLNHFAAGHFYHLKLCLWFLLLLLFCVCLCACKDIEGAAILMILTVTGAYAKASTLYVYSM